ncbi:MAG: hypothetical protein IJV50_11295 [Lachnospiraceae bacterium]|nr:hypothetical protein [Lachnospiraceae bacterium]
MKVLFIGNSHTYYNDMPHLFAEIGACNGIDIDVTMLTKGGMGFDYHVQEEQVRFNILYGHYDYIVLQHVAHPMGDLNVMKEAAIRLAEWIGQTDSKALFYMTWTRKADGEEAQPAMAKPYLELGELLHYPVAPVGQVWWAYHRAHPEVELYFTDDRHASREGSLLAAYTIFETMIGKQAKAPNPLEQGISEIAWTICRK